MHTYDTLDRLPQRCGLALNAAGKSPDRTQFDSVLIVGAGDAAFAGVLFRALTLSTSTIPVTLTVDAVMPRFVGQETLVVVLSETGTDQTAVSAVSNAADAGAQIAIVSPGGHLTDMAEAQGYPCRSIPHAFVAGAPLVAEIFFGLWSMLASSAMASKLLPANAFDEAHTAVDLITRQRRVFGPEADARSNPAHLIADAFEGRIPLVYGTSTLADAAALVWVDRLRRTGLPAHAGDLRGDASAEGWPVTTPMRTPPLEALVLVDPASPERVAVDKLQSAFGKSVTVNELSMDGSTDLERLWGAVYLAEWTSFYLAP